MGVHHADVGGELADGGRTVPGLVEASPWEQV
jgi:hypothetical protein